MAREATGAEGEARRRIADRGRITFAEFMAVALYWPNGGYYASARNPLGASGDFYTSPHVHPLFGALLARQAEQAWRLLGSPPGFAVVEAGAGDGRLAADVLAALPTLRYLGVDLRPPPARAFGLAWALSAGLPVRGLHGVVLTNELLDAMPVHRVTMQDGALREVYAAAGAGGALTADLGPLSSPALAARLDALGVRLGQGQTAEVNLALGDWLRSLATSLERGWALLIDYGHEARDYYAPSRARGTLRCYYQHTVSADPFRLVGRQDMGAHVELTTLKREAADAGLALAGDVSQAEFLRNLGLAEARTRVLARSGLRPAERRANADAVDALADLDGLGGFRVVGLAKGIGNARLAGFDPSTADGLLPLPEPPLLTAAHLPRPGAPPPSDPLSWDELAR
ncbi:MAG: SAM-dependent methyltransferase [Chloroflexota bacterium]|nr:SAM-dependent methyltransferase [Chloroflexota bacterium]